MAVLAQLLEPGMEVADVADQPLHELAFELHHQPEHPVGRRMLGAEVHQHVLGAELVVAGLATNPQWDPRGAPLLVQPRGRQVELDRTGAHRISPRSPAWSRRFTSSGSSSNASAMESSSSE